MRIQVYQKRLPSFFSRFRHSENGTFTVEAVIWFPIFFILLAIIMNITMVFYTESQIMRVVQDANRAVSLNLLETETDAETFIQEQLAYLDAPLTVDTTITSTLVTTVLTTPATELMPFNFMTSAFSGINVGARAQHIIEY